MDRAERIKAAEIGRARRKGKKGVRKGWKENEKAGWGSKAVEGGRKGEEGRETVINGFGTDYIKPIL